MTPDPSWGGRWSRGDQIVLREVHRGRIWAARPVTVVQDTADLIAVHMAVGTPWKRPVAAHAGRPLRLQAQEWLLADDVWVDNDVLHLVTPGAAHAVLVCWAGSERRFAGWYVNLQEPLRRRRIGFDYLDQALDIIVAPDLSWRLKDEDELEQATALGIISREQAEAIRRETAAVIRRIEARAFPFDSDWPDWRPDPRWQIPRFPPGWDALEEETP